MNDRILVVGAGGLLGRALVDQGLTGLSRRECDVTLESHRERALARYRPRAVIYCAARTAVDACEDDDDAHRVNAVAPGAWARRVPLWYVSTNFVFSGPGPHAPGDAVRPLQAYGRQKAQGERAVLAAGGHVVRTAWLFGAGGRNFPSTLVHRLRQGPVRAVEQVPVQPTWAPDLAEYLSTLPRGTTHAVGAETTTWAHFARAVARALGQPHRVEGVTLDDLRLRAPRPHDARLAPATLPGWSRRLGHLLRQAETPTRNRSSPSPG